MQFNQERPRLQYRSARSRAQNLIARTLAVAGAGVALVIAIAISFVLFAIALAVLAGFGIYLWWKTRDVRKRMRAAQTDMTQMDVSEGVIIREVSHRRTDRL